MAKLLTHRTDNDIKNKWYSMKRTQTRLGANESAFASSFAAETADADENDFGSIETAEIDDSFRPRNWGCKGTAG